MVALIVLLEKCSPASKGANDYYLGVLMVRSISLIRMVLLPIRPFPSVWITPGNANSKEETADSITKVKVTPENMTVENPEAEVKQITPQQETFAGYPAPLTGGDNRTLTNVSYNDIAGNLFENDIIKLGEKSITTGYPDGGFHPLESIERWEQWQRTYIAWRVLLNLRHPRNLLSVMFLQPTPL